MSRERKTVRCAIYTRKSSEEGLEQDFNSLHAQREACEAYIASQKHEGWIIVTTAYDDGGYSGGTMDRPALQRLLEDIRQRTVDIVVVYKVDRLTRALSDFARIIDVFDAAGASFVSVTQAFNTTTSMGRLTLNVLLSFAQFEREVTGERIRDKIAASKKKGLWMGGFAPIGYEAAGRTLVVNEAEAETVRLIYDRYLALRSVDALKAELDRRGLRTKLRPGKKERMTGGTPFSRGHLYRILANPIYAGKIEHRGVTYEGQHEAIIDEQTFEVAKGILTANSHARLVKAHSKNPALLSGLLFDASGDRFVASHATRQGKRYRYYLSRAAARRLRESDTEGQSGTRGPVWRLPATEIEEAVTRILVGVLTDRHWIAEHLHTTADPIDARNGITARAEELAHQLSGEDKIARRGVFLVLVGRITLQEDRMTIALKPGGVDAETVTTAGADDADATDQTIEIERPLALRRRGRETRLVIPATGPADPERDPALIRAVAQAHRWWIDLLDRRFETLREIARAYDTDERYVAFVIKLAFLPPDLVRQILTGTHPVDLTLAQLLKTGHSPTKRSPGSDVP